MNIFRKGHVTTPEIVDWLRRLRGHPYVPASGFAVTAVFRARLGADDDYYFSGVNVENPDHRLSTHGEEGALAAMIAGLGKKAEVVEGWVMGAPAILKPGSADPLADNKVTCCGKCRQQIAGFAGPDVVIHSVSLNGAMASTTVGVFLPDAFTFRDCMPAAAAERRALSSLASPAAADVENRLIRQGPLTDAAILDWLKSLESVDYATKNGQTAVVALGNGFFVAGVKIEDAAFVSMNPAQSAMAIAVCAFGAQRVKGVWTRAQGRDGQELAPEAFQPLSLAAIQTLAQFADSLDIPVTVFNARGAIDVLRLKDTAADPPTFAMPFYNRAKS